MSGKGSISCDKIRDALTDYAMGDLSAERAWLISEHIRGCRDCAEEYRRIVHALDALRGVPQVESPSSLNASSRRRLKIAVMHPVLDWIYRHHKLVAWLVAISIFIAVMAIAYVCRIKPQTVIYWL